MSRGFLYQKGFFAFPGPSEYPPFSVLLSCGIFFYCKSSIFSCTSRWSQHVSSETVGSDIVFSMPPLSKTAWLFPLLGLMRHSGPGINLVSCISLSLHGIFFFSLLVKAVILLPRGLFPPESPWEFPPRFDKVLQTPREDVISDHPVERFFFGPPSWSMPPPKII